MFIPAMTWGLDLDSHDNPIAKQIFIEKVLDCILQQPEGR